jgi:hypothetical protein
MGRHVYDFVLDPAPRCPACGSTAGTRNGCCAVCYCPSAEHQRKMSGQRATLFHVLPVLRARGGTTQSTYSRHDSRRERAH